MGNACTYASGRPDSFDTYASHRPSGENCPSLSSNIVCRTANGFRLSAGSGRPEPVEARSPVIGSAHKSSPVFGLLTRKSRKRPSDDHDWGTLVIAETSSGASAPAPLEGLS